MHEFRNIMIPCGNKLYFTDSIKAIPHIISSCQFVDKVYRINHPFALHDLYSVIVYVAYKEMNSITQYVIVLQQLLAEFHSSSTTKESHVTKVYYVRIFSTLSCV